jgi:hypothetical protein
MRRLFPCVCVFLFLFVRVQGAAAQNSPAAPSAGSEAPDAPASSGAAEVEDTVYPVERQRVTPLSSNAVSALGAARLRARAEKLAQTSRWRRLLFITPGWFSRSKSVVDSDTFFFAPGGRVDPEAELEASLEAMFHAVDDFAAPDVHPQCRFPARFAFFKDTLGLDDAHLPKPHCAKFKTWFANTRGDGASLVFSSYYLNNPSSMFGHTFVRVHRTHAENTTASRGSPLLDWSVSFAAFPTTNNPLLYAVLGLAGGFPGRFSMMPHYVKAQEYNNHESRDLWEYDLAIGQEGVTRMLASLWEIGNEHIDYYYFDDNCAYILLALIEIARVDVDLTSNFYFWVTPSDTVRVVARVPGLVTNVSYRPSNMSRLLERWEALEGEEREFAVLFTKEPEAFPFDWGPLTSEAKARVLDVMLEYIDFEEKLALGKEPDSRWAPIREKVLRERAGTRVISRPLERKPEGERPDLGHSTNRIGVTGGLLGASGTAPSVPFGQLEWRPSLHDLLAPGVGYPPGMELDFWDMVLRYRAKSTKKTKIGAPENAPAKLTLHKFNLIEIISAQPSTGLLSPWSWRFRLGTEQRESCYGREKSCFLSGMALGAGLTVANHTRSVLAYVLPGVDLGYSDERDMTLFGALSASSGVILRPANQVRVGLRGNTVRRFGVNGAALSDWEARLDTAVSWSTNFETRVGAGYGARAAQKETLEASLSLFRYYE